MLLACGLMTAYGYVFEVFDALYAGEPQESQTLRDRLSGAYAWSYWGAVVFNFVPLQPLWWRRVRAQPVAAVPDRACRRGRHVDGALHAAGHHALSRLAGVVVGALPPDLLGLVALSPASSALFFVPFLLFVRFLPVISVFEIKEAIRGEGGARGAGHA